jgi:hypothetical protein
MLHRYSLIPHGMGPRRLYFVLACLYVSIAAWWTLPANNGGAIKLGASIYSEISNRYAKKHYGKTLHQMRAECFEKWWQEKGLDRNLSEFKDDLRAATIFEPLDLNNVGPCDRAFAPIPHSYRSFSNVAGHLIFYTYQGIKILLLALGGLVCTALMVNTFYWVRAGFREDKA